ncbi:MAG: hypothetical protein J0H02_21075 [Armatimonadetes bacterium]|nr:hypothetical protein [Armatimonadota bacterium]
MDGETPTSNEFPEQDEFGNDLERLRYNLTLTPKQRIEQHNNALRSVLRIREARERARNRETGSGSE